MRLDLKTVLISTLRRGVRAALLVILIAPLLVAHAAGEIDTTFASGSGRYAFRVAGQTVNAARAVALQTDGKIVMVGRCGSSACMARLTFGGVLDLTLTHPWDSTAPAGAFLLSIGESSTATAVAIQPDGKIVVAGETFKEGRSTFFILRINVDGSKDPGFDGANGLGHGQGLLSLSDLPYVFASPLGSVGSAGAALIGPAGTQMMLQPDGKIVLTGTCAGPIDYDFCIIRLNPDGTYDTAFNGPGGNGRGQFLLPVGVGDDYAAAVTLQSDGKILMGGSCDGGSRGLDFCAARLNSADGSFDLSFDGGDNLTQLNGNGKIVIAVSASTGADVAASVVIRPDGYILIAGSCHNGVNFDFCVTHLGSEQGRSNSAVFASGFPGLLLPVASGHDIATGIALQSDGKFVVTGHCVNGTGVRQFCAARLRDDATLDLLYDGNGPSAGNGKFLVPPLLADDLALGLVQQSNGDMVLVGKCTVGSITYFCITRLLHGYQRAAQNCKMDIDGDGRMLATVDALIMTRVMLGLKGNAVIGGIIFPTTATRTTWAAIRGYLVEQCGLSLVL